MPNRIGTNPDIRSEVSYNTKGDVLTKVKGNPASTAKGALTRFVNQHSPSGSPSAIGRAKALAKRMGVYARALHKAGRGTHFRADVLIVEPAGASPVPPNVKKAFDFKFGCEDPKKQKVLEDQQLKYEKATGIRAQCIPINGSIM